ncbi:MAG: hypothetical protein AAF961_03835 [Planctomycetota bacterium]
MDPSSATWPASDVVFDDWGEALVPSVDERISILRRLLVTTAPSGGALNLQCGRFAREASSVN